MEIDALRCFVLAIQLGSVTAAARAVGRSQPAVSAKLKALEREAGELLLIRERRGVRPTRVGQAVYVRAQEILRTADELSADLRARDALQRGSLRVGATDVMAVYYLPRILKRLRRHHPGIQLEVAVEGSRALARRVLSGDLDLALVTLPIEDPELEVREVHREPIDMVAAPDHRLARRRRVALEELSQEAMIEHRRDSITREQVDAVFRVAGLEPYVAMEVSSPAAMRQLVAVGLGIAPLARSLITAEVRAGTLVRLRAPEFRCARRSGLVRRREAPPLRVVAAFTEMLPASPGRHAGRRR